MKKLFLLILFVNVTLLTTAEINRTIAGITLGSDFEVAKEIAKEKGELVGEVPSGILVSGKIKFAGYEWKEFYVSSINGKVSTIAFIREGDDWTTFIDICIELHKRLHEKYLEFSASTKDDIITTDNEVIMNEMYIEKDKTCLSLKGHVVYNGDSELKLMYVDLSNKTSQEDEL